MRKILLTGASGFVGRHVLPVLLNKGYSVYAVSRSQPAEIPFGVTWYQVDILKSKQRDYVMKRIRPTFLLHLAWCARPPFYRQCPENIDWYYATVELVKKFVRYGGKRAVLAGTCLEYEFSQPDCSEEATPLNPDTLYGLCKKSTFQQLQTMALTSDFTFAWARLFYLYGPGQSEAALVPSVIKTLSQGRIFTCLNPELVRDYLYVKDAADAMVQLLHSNICGSVNIGSGQGTRVGSLVQQVASLMKCQSQVRWGTGEKGEPQRIVACTEKLVSLLSWKPRWSLRKGLRQTIEYYLRKIST